MAAAGHVAQPPGTPSAMSAARRCLSIGARGVRTGRADRPHTKQVVDQQQAKVDQVIAMVDADRAAIETAQTNLDYTSIVAPSDGRMGVRMIDPGNIVHASDSSPIVTLTLTQPSAVMFTLSARSLNDVRDAMARGPVEVTALSQDNRHTLGKGTLLLIDNTVDQASATMRLKAMRARAHRRRIRACQPRTQAASGEGDPGQQSDRRDDRRRRE
jgi:multidrug efflux pump subunit AcrA (membrane-fusion protein)